jgi:hypothetical protein
MALSRKPFGIGHMYIHIFLLRMTDTITSQSINLSSWTPCIMERHGLEITSTRGLIGLFRCDRKERDPLTLKMKLYTSEVSLHSPRTRAFAQILLGCTQQSLSVILRDYWTMPITESYSTTWYVLCLRILPPVSNIVIVMRSPHNY